MCYYDLNNMAIDPRLIARLAHSMRWCLIPNLGNMVSSARQTDTIFTVSTSSGLVFLRDNRRRHHYTLCPICAPFSRASPNALPHYLTNPTIMCTTPGSSTPNTTDMTDYNVLYAA